MDVISGPKPRFRVNATPITRPETPKNYGSVDEFVTVPRRRLPARFAGQRGGQFRPMKFACARPC